MQPTKAELIDLIETLEGDIASYPAPKPFEYDFRLDMLNQTLEKARADLAAMEQAPDPRPAEIAY